MQILKLQHPHKYRYIHCEPGFFSAANDSELKKWPNVHKRVTKGIHFCQEDSGVEIGKMIKTFIDSTVHLHQ